MKRIIATLVAVLTLAFTSLGVANAATPATVVNPAGCPAGTYTVVSQTTPYATTLNGTPGNDYMVTNAGGGSSVYGNGGNDCIVLGTYGNYVDGGAGDDKVIANVGGDYILGGVGNDTLLGKGNALVDGQAGIDTCTVGSNGSKVRCEQ